MNPQTKILITGGAGFIGSNTADWFLRKNYNVSAIDNLSRQGTEKNLRWLKKQWGNGLRFIKMDIVREGGKLDRLVRDYDIIFHFAAQVAVTTSIENPYQDFQVNSAGTLHLLEAVRRSGRKPVFIYTSTNKVYGNLDHVSIAAGASGYRYRNLPWGVSENEPLDFHSPYGCSKGAADQYVRDYARIYGLPTVVFRQSCIYGPHQFGMEDQGWVAWFVISALLGKPLTIYGDGHQVRDVLYIDDLCRLYEKAIVSIDSIAGEIYNIGGGPKQAFSLLQTIQLLETIMRKPVAYSFADWRHGDQKVYISDICKIKQALGWEPRTDFSSGLRKLVQWAELHQSLLRRYMTVR